MSDLKNEINEGALIERIARAEEDARERVARAVQEARAEVREVCSALSAMPPRATDLLRDAALAEVTEVNLSSSWNGCDGVDVGPLLLRTPHRGDLYLLQASRTIKPGRYRALFFLVPLQDAPAKE